MPMAPKPYPFSLSALLAVVVAAGAPDLAAQSEDPAQARLVADVSELAAGRAFRVGVRIDLQDGWHVYWRNPGEAGLETEVELDLPEGFVRGPWQWPLPVAFTDDGGLVAYGYAGEVLLSTTVEAPAQLPAKVRIAARGQWLVCRDICLQGGFEDELTLPVGPASVPSADATLFEGWESRLPGRRSPAATVSITRTADGGLEIGATVALGEGVGEVEVFPLQAPGLVVLGASAEPAPDGRSRITVRAERTGDAPLPEELLVLVCYRDAASRRGDYVDLFPW